MKKIFTFIALACLTAVNTMAETEDKSLDSEVTYPIDMTDKMVNAECAGVLGTAGAEGWTITGNGNPPYKYGNFFENWNASASDAKFDYYQVVEGLPTGKYTVTAEIQYDNAANDDEVGIYAYVPKKFIAKCGNKAQTTGFNEYTTPEMFVTEGTLRIGIKTLATQTQQWTAARNFKLTMTGELTIDDFESKVAVFVERAKAKADEGKPMSATVAATLARVIENYDGKKLATFAEGEDAITTINNAIVDADKSIASYALVLDLIESPKLDEKGKKVFEADATVAEISAAITDGSLVEITDDQIAAITDALRVATKAQGVGADMTTAMAIYYWVGETGGYDPLHARERWNAQAYTGDVMSQTIDGLQAGEYQVTLKIAASTTKSRDGEAAGKAASADEAATVMFANDATLGIEVVERLDVTKDEFKEYEVTATVGEDGVLTYGLKNNAVAGNWFVIQGAKLVYVSAPKNPTAVNGVAEAAANAGVKKVVKDGKVIIVKDGKEISADGTM